MVTTAIALTILGLLAGSFLGLVSVRLPAGGGIVAGRSRCDSCGRSLGPLDLIPLLSFALSRGGCRTCAAPIPRRYPMMEAGAALIGLWAGLSQPALLPAALTALLGWQLLLIAVVDAEHFWLPDALTLPLAATGLAAVALLSPHMLVASAIGAAAGLSVVAALWLVRRRMTAPDRLPFGVFLCIGLWMVWVFGPFGG